MTVEQIIGRVFNIEPEALHDLSSRNSIEEWDSMGHLTLVMELEDQFKVNIAIADAMDMESVSKIKAILRSYGVAC